MADQKTLMFMSFILLTSAPSAFGNQRSNNTTRPSETDGNTDGNANSNSQIPETDPAQPQGHLTIIYFCLTSLLFFHISCVLLAFILCVRHSTGDCRFFGGQSEEINTDGDTIAGGIPHRDNSFSISKSLQKDLLAALDSNTASPYSLKFVPHGKPPGQSHEIDFVGHNLPDINELNRKKEEQDQEKQQKKTDDVISDKLGEKFNNKPPMNGSPGTSGCCTVVSSGIAVPGNNNAGIARSRSVHVAPTIQVASTVPDCPPSAPGLEPPTSSLTYDEASSTGCHFARNPLRLSLFLPSSESGTVTSSAGVLGDGSAFPEYPQIPGRANQQKRVRSQLQEGRGAMSLTNRIGSIKNSVFDTFKMASDSISRNFQGSKKEEMGAKNSWTCPICLSDDHIEDVEIGDAVNKDKLPCNHEFHSDCLSDFIKFNLKLRRGFACPMCRKLFSISLVNKEVVKKQ